MTLNFKNNTDGTVWVRISDFQCITRRGYNEHNSYAELPETIIVPSRESQRIDLTMDIKVNPRAFHRELGAGDKLIIILEAKFYKEDPYRLLNLEDYKKFYFTFPLLVLSQRPYTVAMTF
jgi:hypothetical protein